MCWMLTILSDAHLTNRRYALTERLDNAHRWSNPGHLTSTDPAERYGLPRLDPIRCTFSDYEENWFDHYGSKLCADCQAYYRKQDRAIRHEKA